MGLVAAGTAEGVGMLGAEIGKVGRVAEKVAGDDWVGLVGLVVVAVAGEGSYYYIPRCWHKCTTLLHTVRPSRVSPRPHPAAALQKFVSHPA